MLYCGYHAIVVGVELADIFEFPRAPPGQRCCSFKLFFIIVFTRTRVRDEEQLVCDDAETLFCVFG